MMKAFGLLALGLVLAAPLGAQEETRPETHLGPRLDRIDSKSLETKINSLRIAQPAWRHIQWTPCLLDGLALSRKQKKPIVVWCFIDRPIDDERC